MAFRTGGRAARLAQSARLLRLFVAGKRTGGRAERQYLQGGDKDKYVEKAFFKGVVVALPGGLRPPGPPRRADGRTDG